MDVLENGGQARGISLDEGFRLLVEGHLRRRHGLGARLRERARRLGLSECATAGEANQQADRGYRADRAQIQVFHGVSILKRPVHRQFRAFAFYAQ